MEIKHIKIIKVPEVDCVCDKGTWGIPRSYILPLELGVLSSYLRNKGINIEQDDLDIKAYHDNLHYPEKYISGQILSQRREILAYLQGEKNLCLDEISKKLLNKTNLEFDLLLISCQEALEITPRMATFLISKYVKENYKSIVIVGGRGVAQGREDWLLAINSKIVDFVVSGPGEIPLIKLIDALKNDKNLSDIPGITYLKDNRITSTNATSQQQLIVPDFTGLPLDQYASSPLNISIFPVKFMEGCPNKCIFCGASGNSYCSFLPPREAADMLEELFKKYKAKHFYFLHATFNISKGYTNQLCDEIIRRNLKIYWSDCASFKNMDKETLIKLRRAGAIRLVWGLETGSPKMLKYIDKEVSIEQASEILEISHEIGIWNQVEIIPGLPHENNEDIQATLNFLDKNEAYLDGVYPSSFVLKKESLLFKFPKLYGITNIKNIDKTTFQINPDLSGQDRAWRYTFDEVNGLKWEDKKAQIAYSFKKIWNKVGDMNMKSTRTRQTIVVLFYLYTVFKDKKKVKEIFNKWSNRYK